MLTFYVHTQNKPDDVFMICTFGSESKHKQVVQVQIFFDQYYITISVTKANIHESYFTQC